MHVLKFTSVFATSVQALIFHFGSLSDYIFCLNLPNHNILAKNSNQTIFFVFNLVMCLISFGLCLLCSAFTANVGGLFLEETLWPLLWKKSNRFEVPALHVLKFMHDFYTGGKKKDLYDFYIIALRFLYLHFEKHFRTIHHMWGAWNACTTCALIF